MGAKDHLSNKLRAEFDQSKKMNDQNGRNVQIVTKQNAANVTQINALNENKNLAKELRFLLLNFCQFIFFMCFCEYFSLSLSLNADRTVNSSSNYD